MSLPGSGRRGHSCLQTSRRWSPVPPARLQGNAHPSWGPGIFLKHCALQAQDLAGHPHLGRSGGTKRRQALAESRLQRDCRLPRPRAPAVLLAPALLHRWSSQSAQAPNASPGAGSPTSEHGRGKRRLPRSKRLKSKQSNSEAAAARAASGSRVTKGKINSSTSEMGRRQRKDTS